MENNSDVMGLIRETCLQIIPEIVNNVLNKHRSQELQTTESDSDILSETDDMISNTSNEHSLGWMEL